MSRYTYGEMEEFRTLFTQADENETGYVGQADLERILKQMFQDQVDEDSMRSVVE